MRCFFDSYALIELVKENKAYLKYLEETVVTSILNIGEFYYALLREHGEKTAETIFRKLNFAVLEINQEVMIKAMKFKFEHKQLNFSFVDCVSYILALEHNFKFLTGDKEFEKLEHVEFVK